MQKWRRGADADGRFGRRSRFVHHDRRLAGRGATKEIRRADQRPYPLEGRNPHPRPAAGRAGQRRGVGAQRPLDASARLGSVRLRDGADPAVGRDAGGFRYQQDLPRRGDITSRPGADPVAAPRHEVDRASCARPVRFGGLEHVPARPLAALPLAPDPRRGRRRQQRPKCGGGAQSGTWSTPAGAGHGPGQSSVATVAEPVERHRGRGGCRRIRRVLLQHLEHGRFDEWDAIGHHQRGGDHVHDAVADALQRAVGASPATSINAATPRCTTPPRC